MHEFTLLPEATRELQQAFLKRIPLLLIVVLLMVFVVPMMMGGPTRDIGTSTWLTLILMCGVMSFSLYTSLKRQKAMLLTYKLTITEDSITREMQNVPTIVIPIKSITAIRKSVAGGYTIIGDSKMNAIGVSTHVDRKEELEQLLTQLSPLTVETSVALWTKWQYPIIIGLIVLMFASYYVSNKYIATLCGVITVGVLVYSFVAIKISKNVEQRVKRYSYFILFPILSIIGAVIVKWME